MQNLGFYFADIARLMRKRFDAERNGGMTGAQWRVLAAVVRNPGLNQGKLAELLEVEPITVCRMIDRMEQAGLVERRNDPQDRRARLLYPSGNSDALLVKLSSHGDRLIATMTAGLDDADRERLTALLEQIRTNLLDDVLFAPREVANG